MPPKKTTTAKNEDQFKSSKDTNNDGRITRSEGDEGAIGDLNSDGRVTRSEARAAKKAGFPVDFDAMK
ncbi:hypothetical protein B484DRAFT_425246 [Ochromonadaceae sp. CCMP2298]|nr:hypothetical protein B484DRAFT_425246 [Ochromonadaceae sp. CCMP2298]